MSASQPANFNLQEFSDAGLLLFGGRLYTYAYGTTTQKTAYTDAAGAVPHTYTADGLGGQYIALNARGELPAPLYLAAGSYDIALRRADGSTVWTRRADPTADGIVSLLVNLLTSVGASLIGFVQAGVGAVLLTVQDKLRERVTPLDFGAVGNGVADDSAAIQKAINTGKAVDLGDASKTYLVTATITYIGQVHIRAKGATIKHAISVLPMRFTDASGSRVRGLHFMPLVTPYTLLRNTTTWVNVVGDVVQSLEGYMPTSQDEDLWPTLSAPIKAQYDNFQPGGIKFDVSSVAGGTDVVVENITGYQACITIEGYSNSVVRNCNFGGKREGIYFYNALASTNGVFTLPRGVNNKALNNTVKYAGQCAIVFFGNDDFQAIGNTTYLNGESGIKTYQHDPSMGVAVMCTNGVISGNTVYNNYYDGIDATNVNGIDSPGTYPTGHVVADNRSRNNRHTGITICGSGYNVSGNEVSENGSHGINAQGVHSLIASNMARNNAAHPEIHAFQIFDIVVQGDGLNSAGNKIYNASAPSTWNYLHSGLAGADPTPSNEGIDIGNQCSHGASRVYLSPNIPTGDNLLIGAGTRALTNDAIAVFRQGGAGVDIGGAADIGVVRIRGDAATSGNLDFTPNTTDPAGSPGYKGRILYDFTNNLIRMLVNGGTASVYLQSGVGFFPSPDNTLSLGASGLRWSQLYAGNGTINTSDEREKQQIGPIDGAVLRAWAKVNFCQFKFNDAVELKGDGARWHFGVIAQQVKAAFESERLDPFAYGVLCYDEWPATEEMESGNRYGIRYEEALVLECAYLRSKLAP